MEANLRTRQERSGCNTDGKGNDVALSGIVGHRVGAYRGNGVVGLQRENVEFLPCADIVFANQRLVEILVVVDAVVCWNLDLGV